MFSFWRIEISRWTGPKFGWAEYFSFYSGPQEAAKRLLVEYARTMNAACKLKLLDDFGEEIALVDAGEGATVDVTALETTLKG